jgi:CPA1 family monovalent cation:H+ antiporter
VRSAEILVGLLGTVTVLAGIARRVGVPAPILLVLCGLLVGLVPGLPSARLDPDLVFFIFLPPLVYGAGFNSSPRDLCAQARRIGILAIGLVAATTAAVAVAVHMVVPGFGWPEAFVLGAVLAPTDPVAAVAVLHGLLAGAVIVRVRGRIDDAPIEIGLSLFTPYAAYIAAEALGASGILAAVTVGLYLGARSDGLFSPNARIEARGFWNALVFMLESTLFLLMGLQFRDVVAGIAGLDATHVTLAVVVTTVVVIGLRLLFMFTISPLLRMMIPQPRNEPPDLGHGARLVAGWAGMRGAVSLAAALAIPAHVHGGAPFPQRDLMVFVVFCVIVIGLLAQGLTLPALIRATGLARDEHEDAVDEARARAAAAEAALERLSQLEDEREDDRALAHLRELYEARLGHSRAPMDESGDEDRRHVEAFQRMREELLRSERGALHELHNRGEISEDALRTVERDLDLQEARLE